MREPIIACQNAECGLVFSIGDSSAPPPQICPSCGKPFDGPESDTEIPATA
jgi:hypothetical protein